ncbi:YopT-type cysteine protease domain-containing protein [[Haemophilus] ducreyi]|uniref:Large supernatant protein 1 n=1 Tax=Haemophilus ducreyi (strain 35000HP / ATCC 700724) TaxID=233412 RepID=Q7VLE8_HAEDU|nr:YopT-type cysteine protease domain-containing protein [[Haemophilus] ducreyi]AAP96300.1 large supernatant protein 1 [[Haemophilus] ducreyi 35000HP]ASE07179.1 YopT-type cysteine protease domain-containing protein [[Haemophilus] ducreyi]
MNNKRYKLIFSKVKNCLVPVAENIKSASGNSGSSSNSKIAEDQEEEPDSLACSLSPLSSSIHLGLHNHSPLKVFKGKSLSVVLLSLMPATPLLAQQNYAEALNGKVYVDSQHSSTRIYEQKTNDNSKDGIVVVEIANPEVDGVSDNRFKEFNIPNSAVFNNSRTESTSQLVGKLHANIQLQKEAKLILNQVTGDHESNIQGALEVAGKKADLIIVNPNGITLNGVKTINTDRFVVSTSDIIPHRENGLLSVRNGKVTIDKGGVATNGLSHFEVVARNIDQKGKITVAKTENQKSVNPANITFAAGSLNYNLKTREATPISSGTSRTSDTPAISADSAGSMYGSNIKFVVTDKGAGVKHKGIIFSENDINIKMDGGNASLKELYAKKDIDILAKDIELTEKGQLQANNKIILNSTGKINLRNASEVSADNVNVKSENLALENASMSANSLDVIVTKIEVNRSSKVSAGTANIKASNITLDGSSVVANKITLNVTNNATLNNQSKLSAKDMELNVTHNITLNNTSKLSAQKANIKTENLTLNGEASLVAEKLDINAIDKITNNGTIAGLTANITTKALENRDNALILAHQNLNFTVNGSHYVNKGDIVSKDKAIVTFSNNSDFTSNGSKLVDAQNNLTVNVNNFNITQGSEIILHGNVTLNAKGNFTNSGNLTTMKELNISNIESFINAGNLTTGKNLEVHSNTTVKNDGKLVSIENLNISSKTDFTNNGTLLGLEALKIASGGNFTNASNGSLASNKSLDIYGNNFTNNGTIESVKSLNITNNYTFINNATIKSYGVLNITSQGNFTNDSNGTVMSHDLLNITSQANIINKNLLAGGQGLNLTAKGNITNDSNSTAIAVLHSNNDINLNANNKVYNIGEIYSQAGNISVEAKLLHNDVKLSGNITTTTKSGNATVKTNSIGGGLHDANSIRVGELTLNGKFADLDNQLKVALRGKIYAGSNLTFKAKEGEKEQKSTAQAKIINRGTINVKNKLEYGSNVDVENNMRSMQVNLYEKIFNGDNPITLTLKNGVTFAKDFSNRRRRASNDGEGTNKKTFDNVAHLIEEAFSGYSNGNDHRASDDGHVKSPYYLLVLAQAVNNTEGENYLKTALQHIFGPNWNDLTTTNNDTTINDKWNQLKLKWEKFKNNGENNHSINLNIYPADEGVEKAKIFAGVLRNGTNGVEDKVYQELNDKAKKEYEDKFAKKFQGRFKSRFQNGEFDWAGDWAKEGNESYGSKETEEKYNGIKKEHTVNIGKHEIKVPTVSFENLNNINHQQDKSDGIDKSIISELLAQPIYVAKADVPDVDPRVAQNDKAVDEDGLYRTRLSYINQNNYLGAKYFFNQLDTEDDKLKGIKRIGDNYFEHQLITRLIEKVADNHLTLKHGLHDIALVKKLIDSASIQAKDLNLKVGEALTKEQKDNLKEDIVWYVKTEVNGQEVLVPQVYLAKQTIEEVEKQRGVGTGQIRAGIIDVKVDDVRNTGTIAGYAVGLEAKNKLKNTGDILSQRLSKLVGKKGLESTGVTYVDETGATKVRKARIKSEGHIYLETDKDKNVDLTASELKGNTGQIKAKDLNLNDIYETSYKYKYEKLFGKNGGEIGDRVTQTSQAKSVGTDASFDHLHLSLEGDVNQTGSNLKANRTTGVVKGDFNTKAGKDLFHRQIDTVTSGTVYSASASGGGQSAGISLTDQGVETYTNKTATAGANADVTNFMKRTRETETSLTHRNSEFNALSGELYVMGKADIGGVDINRDVEVIKTPEEIAAEQKAAEEAKKAEVKENEASETAAKETEEAENDNVAEKDKTKPKFKKLTDEEIAAAFETKGEDFFAAYKAREEEDRKKGFTLSAEQIESTKARDEKETTYYELKVGVGAEAEAHSAAADAISNKARQIIDTQNGLKQDGTVALQEASDVLNLATGDLAGASAKLKFELSTIEKKSRGASDGRSILGGRLNLAARGGDITLNNVETTENSHLSLKARDNVNVNSGVTEQKDESNSQSLKVTAGASSGCGVMAGGCSAGVSAGVSGSYNESNTESTSHTNSLLRGKSLRVEAGKDFNLISSNVDVDHLHLDVKGDTNVVSKQDSYSRKERGVNYSVSAGVGVSTAGGARPNGSVGLGVSAENENSKIVKQQAGISAKRITGEINNLNLTGGYIENKGNPDELNVKGDITTHELKDEHHKDGGSFGGSVGVSETGVTQVNVNGGRVEQKHYEATQHSSISGINTKGKTVGNFKTDRSQSTEVHRDDTIAATNFNFELGDIAELAKKGKEKWDNRSAKTTSSSQDSAHDPRSRSVENGYSELPRFKTADNDAGVDSPRLIKGEAEQAQTLALTKAGNDVIPEVQSLTQKARPQSLVDESPYAEIPALTRPQVKSNIAESIEVPQFRTKVSDGDEGNYAEITFPTNKAAISSTQDVGDTPTPRALRLESESGYESAENLGLIPRGFKSSPKGEYEDISDAIEPQTRSRKLDEPEPIYGTINKSPEAIARANAKADEAIQALGYDPRIKPVVPEEAPPALPPRNLQTKAISDYDDVSYVPDFKVRKTDEPEPIYGTINKSPEAIARANAKADEAIQASGYDPRIKPVVPEDAPPALPPRTQSLIDSTEVPSYRSALANVKFDDASPWPQPSALRSKAFADEPSSETPKSRGKRGISEESLSSTVQPRSRKISEEDSSFERLPLRIIDNGSDYAEILPRNVKQTNEPATQAIRAPKALDNNDVIAERPSFKLRQLDDDVESVNGIYSSIKPKALIEEGTPITRQVKTVQEETPVTDLVNKRELVKEDRSLLDKVQDTFQPLKVRSKINDVRSSVEEYGGEVTFKYAQSKGEVYNEIVKHAETQNGVCEATCSHWIAKKVNDENIWTDLYKDGQKGRKGGLNKDAIESIEKLQTEFINAGTATQQFKLTNTWLEEQGVVPKQKYFGKLSRADEVAGTVSKNDVSALVKAILDTGNESSAVKKISINLEGGSHTVSASIEGQKVVFFDPNFGEITFKDKKSFEKWMKNAFWKKSGYAGKKDTKRFFNVVNYHKNSKRNKVIDVNQNHIQQLAGSEGFSPSLPTRPQLANAAGIKSNEMSSLFSWSKLKHLFSRESGKKAQVEGPEIKHLGGVVDKDAFYFPLDKIVTRRDAEGEIRVNMDNIKKAFNPRDKHYNSQEARSLRSLYNQDPSMSGTRFIIENQVIANPFSSADLQSYIQAQQSKLPELGRQARRALPELPTAANKGRGSRVEEQNIVTRPRVEDVYATVNKGAKHGEAQQPGSFYTKKLVDQVSHVPNTEPVYADLHFNRNGRVVRQTEPEVIYEKIRGQQVEVDDPSSLYAKVNRNRRLDNVEGFYPPEQLRTRSDKLAEQVSRVPTTEPVYADLRFKSAEDDYAPALPARPELGNAAGFRKAKVKGEESESTWSRLKHLFSRESGKTKVEEVENEYKSQTNGENSLEIKTIEHIPTRLKNLESPREAQSDLGENALIYGLQRGRQALISKANAADKEGKNAILADSYIGKLNLGFEFGELTKFAKQVKDGKVTEQDIQNIASFNDETAKLARRSEPKNRINDANVDDNQRIIRELINNEAAVDALKRIATLSDQEKAMHSTLRANEKFDMDELEESPNYTTAENKSIRDYKDTQKALNDARMDFFTEKTKFIAKETLERGGQLYFALDGLVTNSPGFRADTQINMDKLKDVFNPNHEHYDSVTSRELRYLYENYKDNPNLKFTLKDHVIANPLKTLKTSISESDLKSSPRRARQEGPSLLQRVRNLFDKSSSNKRSEKDTAQTSVGYRNTNIDIINDKTKGVNHIVENGVEVALTNTDYKPLKLPNVEAAFKQTKLKAENIDPHIEAVKKLEIIASSANSIPKEHLLKALIEVTEGKTDEDINVYQKLFNTRQNISNEVAPTYSLRNLDGKDGKQILRSVAEIYKNLPLSDTYQAVRNYVNNRLIEKLSSNRLLLEHLANSKISGNEYAIKYIFDTVSRAKQEIFEQELNTELAPVSLDIMRRKAANILSSEHGSYKDGTLSIYDKPVKSAFHSRLKNNGEVLNTIVHELTHHEQDALAKIIDNKGYDAKLFDKNNILYITGGLGYPKQALERDAFLSGDSVSEAFMKKAKEYHERTKQERKDAKKDEARIAKLYKQWEQEEANKKSASLNGSSQSLDSRSEVEFNRVSHKSVR